MQPLSTFTLPLATDAPHAGDEDGDDSLSSATTAFEDAIDKRDMLFGLPRCIVCGMSIPVVLDHFGIVGGSELQLWDELRSERRWIPPQVKEHPGHEPRNGLLMCANHHKLFEGNEFFIRLELQTHRYILVNYTDSPHLRDHHGKAVALDIDHPRAPFPTLFLLHEQRVREDRPSTAHPVDADMPQDILWQDWLMTAGDDAGTSTSTPQSGSANGAVSSETRPLPALDDALVAEIVEVTRAMPSWKACEMEVIGEQWAGTAEKNIEIYVTSMSIEHDEDEG